MTRHVDKRFGWRALVVALLALGLPAGSGRQPHAEGAPARSAALAALGGGPIGSAGFPISPVSNASGHYNEMHPSVVFNSGFMQTYLAVWDQLNPDGTSTSVYGQFVSMDGSLNGSRFRISPEVGPNTNADVAYNPDLDQYLVVYEVGGIGIYGQIINNAGSPAGPERTIVSGFVPTDTFRTPAVAYSPTSGKYLVTWRHNQGSFQGIEARTLSGEGSSWGSVWGLTGMIASDPEQPDVAYSSPTDEFLVVWQKTATPNPDHDIYGQRIQMGASPGPVGSVFSIHYTANDETAPSVAAIAKLTGIGQYLIVCQTDYSGTLYVDGQLVTDAGALDGSPIYISPSSGSVPAVAGNERTLEYLAAWIHTPQVHARTISTTGAMGQVAQLSGRVPWNPAVGSGPPGDFLITVDDWVSSAYPYDIFGYLWGTRVYLPLVTRN